MVIPKILEKINGGSSYLMPRKIFLLSTTEQKWNKKYSEKADMQFAIFTAILYVIHRNKKKEKTTIFIFLIYHVLQVHVYSQLNIYVHVNIVCIKECTTCIKALITGPTDNILYCRDQEPKKGIILRVSKFPAKKTAHRLKRFIKGLGACRK